MKNKVIILANDTTYTYNLRREIIEKFIEEGYQICVVSKVLKFKEELENLGCKLIDVDSGRHGTNPLSDIMLMLKYYEIIVREKPDVVFSYNIKPNVYGGMACQLSGRKYFPNITGLGTAVEYPGKLQKITTVLYKIGVAGATCVFFQNEENKKFFVDKKLLAKKCQTQLLPGSGVSLTTHKLIEYPQSTGTINFLFVARVMKEKGIDLYLTAAKAIHQKYGNVLFHICGQCDDEKYETILKDAQDSGYVKYHGEQKDMRSFFAMAHCVVHPSYYPEGMSNVLLEAAAHGRPIITTNRSGCQETVDDEISGYLVSQKNEAELITAIHKFMELSDEQRKEMGLAGRRKVEKEFDREIVVRHYWNAMEKCDIKRKKK